MCKYSSFYIYVKGKCPIKAYDKTDQRLAKALIDMTRTVPLSHIRVGDLCDWCGFHRRTFYHHFRDIYDLTAWIFDQAVDEYLPGPDRNPGTAGLVKALESLRENAAFFRRALQEDSQNALGRHILSHDLRIYEEALKRMTGKTAVSAEDAFAIQYYCFGSLGMIRRWLLSDCQQPPQEMAGLMISVMPPVLRLIFDIRTEDA